MTDPELKAMGIIAQALADLSADQRRNILLYVNARFGADVSHHLAADSRSVEEPNAGEYGTLGDFFDAANPQTEADRVLVVGYWLQVVEGEADIESYPINKHLKNLGHPVSNITRALEFAYRSDASSGPSDEQDRQRKAGSKKYKVTREGTKRVSTMLVKKGEPHGR